MKENFYCVETLLIVRGKRSAYVAGGGFVGSLAPALYYLVALRFQCANTVVQTLPVNSPLFAPVTIMRAGPLPFVSPSPDYYQPTITMSYLPRRTSQHETSRPSRS